MPRIVKDYTQRGRRTPQNIAPSVIADEAKLSGNSGSATALSHREAIISHENAVIARTKRRAIPNAKLRAK